MQNPKCRKCEKTVYSAELINAGKLSWHKRCFKCESCGFKLTKGAQKELGDKIVCARCYDREKDNAKVYSKLDEEKEQKQQSCSDCKEEVTPGAKFCGNCGNKLVAA